MHPARRSALATVVATLKTAGYSAEIPTGRDKRPGFKVRDARGVPRPGVYVSADSLHGQFGALCAALAAAGFRLEACSGGQEHVARGFARVLPPA